MSDYCEICEALVVATSSCPATDVIMVVVSTGSASSELVAGVTPQGVLVSSAEASSSAIVDTYAILIDTATATDMAMPSVAIEHLASDSARATSRVILSFEQIAESEALATSEMFHDIDVRVLVSSASASSSVVASVVAEVLLVSKAKAVSAVLSMGLLEIATGSAEATSSVVPTRVVSADETSTAEATAEVFASNVPHVPLLTSFADGSSAVIMVVESNALLTSSAEAESFVWFKDPAKKAWVMNTETSAGSWYDNYDFESMVSWQGREYGVGPDGIYELTGAVDDGELIEASVESGFVDFGVAQQKRLDNLYFGYTSDGRLSVQTEVYESGTPPRTYLMDSHEAAAPRNNRVTPGKGLYGRYWRLTIKNVDGANFDVHDASVDLAISARRI